MKVILLLFIVFSMRLQATEQTPITEQIKIEKQSVVPAGDPIGVAVESYFKAFFDEMKKVAVKRPNKYTFRELMKPLERSVDGFKDGSFIDNQYIIQQSYKAHIISPVGYDLKKQPELKEFLKMMDAAPAPQLSEPAHIPFYPSFITLRYPILSEKGDLIGVISIFVKTKHFTEMTMLNQCRAYKITCRGTLAEKKKRLSDNAKTVTVQLPSTEWVIEYDAPKKGFVERITHD